MFKEIDINNIEFDAFKKIDEWALVSANNNNSINTMTISWGSFGVLWNKKVATIYIRESRYTKEFIDNSDYFTISFYNNEYKEQLKYLGTKSGRNTNKIKDVNFNPIIDNNISYFKEANMVIVCKKIYKDLLDKNNFLDDNIINNYGNNDYHTIYIGEIEKILIKV